MSTRKFNKGAQTNPNYKKGSVRNPIRDTAAKNRKGRKTTRERTAKENKDSLEAARKKFEATRKNQEAINRGF